MKSLLAKVCMFTVLLLAFGCISSAFALEIITREDIVMEIVVDTDLIKTADNAIILFDSSSSMDKPYKDTGMTRYEIAKKTLKERNEYFPDLGYNFGLYLYTPWKEIYPMQEYDRDKFAQALETLPEKATSATNLRDGLKRLDPILKNLEGKTAVFIYTDGTYSSTGSGGIKKPHELAYELAKKYNVCFYLISTADDMYSLDLFKKVTDFNFCSRAIAFEDFIDREVYNSEALFTVKATENIVTTTEQKMVGIITNNFLFGFDKSDLSQDEMDRLQILAAYLKKNENAFAAMAGYTDSIGTEEYNLVLSLRRVESIASYLVETLNVNPSQLIPFWYGKLNPIADNSTLEGRAQNRRVEILVGGMTN